MPARKEAHIDKCSDQPEGQNAHIHTCQKERQIAMCGRHQIKYVHKYIYGHGHYKPCTASNEIILTDGLNGAYFQYATNFPLILGW